MGIDEGERTIVKRRRATPGPCPATPLQKELDHDKAGKRYRLIAYIRVDPEDEEPMTFREALADQEQQRLLFPENIYRIEKVKTVIGKEDQHYGAKGT